MKSQLLRGRPARAAIRRTPVIPMLHQRGLAWPHDEAATVRLSARQWEWLVAGLPWQRMTAAARARAIRVI